jgi:putative transposase
LLYSSGRKGKPGPKDPSKILIQAIVELKQRNSRFGCRRIAQQINKAFGVAIDKDVVRHVLETHYRAYPDDRWCEDVMLECEFYFGADPNPEIS